MATTTTTVMAGAQFPSLGSQFPVPFSVEHVHPVKPEVQIRERFGEQEVVRVVRMSVLTYFLRLSGLAPAAVRRPAQNWRPTLAVLPTLVPEAEAEARYVLAMEAEAKLELEAAKVTWGCRDCGAEFWFDGPARMLPSCPECSGVDTYNQFEDMVNRLD